MQCYVYACVPQPDAKTDRLKATVAAAGGVWRDVAALGPQQLAEAVRADGVDVLVELTGHTAHNRLDAMARKPAPVQVTWIGYPNSTGLPTMDYRFTDAVCDPEDTKQTYVERLLRLPGCFLCYTPPPHAPPVSPLPALTNGYVTFGSFNALAKITPEVMQMWGRILQAVPHSRLLLKNKPFACEAARQHYMNALREQGIDGRSVDLLPLQSETAEHLSTYAGMDISLDPWPYAGTTTTCESLFMGVPCITLRGGCHAHNVGVSLLTEVGMFEGWVACDLDAYVDCAVHAASDLQALAGIRAGLRQRMLSSRLCDAPEFVAGLEEVYRSLWHTWLDGAGACMLPHGE